MLFGVTRLASISGIEPWHLSNLGSPTRTKAHLVAEVRLSLPRCYKDDPLSDWYARDAEYRFYDC
jgi:hypothetical protein